MSHETFKAPELDQLAELLPAYDFESFIAQGGMGAVYKATQRSLDREVAIKILPRELGADPEFRESFETEAKAMAKLNHPNLLGVFDYGDIDGMPYIVMEFISGKSLYYSAWNQIIEPEQAIEIVKGICEGLDHAHDHGILHRDIKPANILLTAKAQPKIGDFGLAQHVGSTSSGTIMGTPGYAAPELTQAPETAGIGADIYAVGVILHELITGQRPDPTGAELPQPFGDRGLDAIWQKATDPVIAKRYASTKEMAAALSSWRPSTRRLTTGAKPANWMPKSLAIATGARQAGSKPKPVTIATAANPAGSKPKPLAVATPAAKVETPSPASAPAPSTRVSPPPVVAPTGANWSLARNMVIIAILVAVFGFGYKMIQRAKKNSSAEDDAAKKELFEKKQKAAAELKKQKLAAESNASKPKPPSTVISEPATKNPDDLPPIENKESNLESLARLKDDLAEGKRDELPKGSKRSGTNDYLFIKKPMTWYAAQAFAEQHGAHIAILESNEEITWLSQLVPDDQSVWLGTGRSERNVWTDNDGSDWSLEEEPKGVGPFASLTNLGVLRAGKTDETMPFVIQWHRDGSNPGTLNTILERTSKTLDTPNPIYPPGTISLGARQILFLPLAAKRDHAKSLAKMAAGILAVPSSRKEIGWFADESESMEASAGFWLGGQRKDGVWTWDSGEVWDKMDWTDDTEPVEGGDALIFVPGKGWSNADPDTPAAGLIIEWSRDAPTE